MQRRREVPVRKVLPDSKYNSELVSRFVNCIMKDGKKSIALSIIYDAFDIVEKRTNITTISPNSTLKFFNDHSIMGGHPFSRIGVMFSKKKWSIEENDEISSINVAIESSTMNKITLVLPIASIPELTA